MVPMMLLSKAVIFNWMARPLPAVVCEQLGALSAAADRVTVSVSDASSDEGEVGTASAKTPLGHLHLAFRDYHLTVSDPSIPASDPSADIDAQVDPERAGKVVRDWYLGLGDRTVKQLCADWRAKRPGSHNFDITSEQREKLESVRNRLRASFASIHGACDC